jgi:hypothetical protein
LSLNARSYVFDAGVISLFYAGVKSVKPYFARCIRDALGGP